MKRSSPLFRILAAFVLAGVLLFFGVQIWQYFSDPLTTTLVYRAQTEVTLSVDGWVIREEESVPSGGGTLLHALSEGEKVGVDQLIATAYTSAGALDTVKEIESKTLQLQQLEFALSSYLDPDAALKLDGTITENLLDLRGGLSKGDYSSAADDISELKGNILKRSHSYATAPEIQQEIRTVQGQLSELRSRLSGVTTIRAQRGGLYSAVCDGYESVLTPAFLQELTPAALAAIPAGSSTGSEVGKLIYGDTWYYAFALSAEDAALMLDSDTVTLRFAKGLEQDVVVDIVSVSAVQDGKQAVVVSCDKYMAQVTQLRHQTATLVLDSYSGLRIPANALRLSEGQSGVYCLVGFNAKFKPVDVVYRGDGYTLVRAAEKTEGGDILRVGDEVIVTASELFDGKVVQ